MDISTFVELSHGEWRSMRSGHSLAFQYFEEVLSEVKIQCLDENDKSVAELASSVERIKGELIAPFSMEWEAESDWEPDDPTAVSSGQCILIPYQIDESHGHIIRSVGYA